MSLRKLHALQYPLWQSLDVRGMLCYRHTKSELEFTLVFAPLRHVFRCQAVANAGGMVRRE